MKDSVLGDTYVTLIVKEGASMLDTQAFGDTPFLTDNGLSSGKALPDLRFVPYYFRANRGGRGHMRVGLKRAA